MMTVSDHGDEEKSEFFVVVVNHEEQYSIWPSWRERPLGWDQVGDPAPREECLDWIEENWTDMRPKSVRDFLNGDAKTPQATHDG